MQKFSANGLIFFAADDILDLAKDQAWLGRTTNPLNQYWEKKNPAEVGRCSDSSDRGHALVVVTVH